LPPTIAAPIIPLVIEKESNGCDDDNSTPVIVKPTPIVKSHPLEDECRASGEVRVIQSDIKQPAPVINIPLEPNPVRWNQFNKVVQDHRNGTIDLPETNKERAKRGLITPWTPEISEKEVKEPPVQ
jgi:hypothetical protein